MRADVMTAGAMRRRRWLGGAALLLLGGVALAPRAWADGVTVTGAWSRVTAPHATTGVVYLTLTSKQDDALTGVSSPAADSAMVHETTQQGGVMRMRPVEGGLPLPAGKPVKLSPGGYHIMLMGLKAPLKAGEHVDLHLTFRTAPPEDVTAEVRGAGAAHGPAMQGMPDMPGMKMN